MGSESSFGVGAGNGILFAIFLKTSIDASGTGIAQQIVKALWPSIPESAPIWFIPAILLLLAVLPVIVVYKGFKEDFGGYGIGYLVGFFLIFIFA